MSTVLDPYAVGTPEPTPEPEVPAPEPEPNPEAGKRQSEACLDFRKTPVKGRMPKIEVWVEGMWMPVGVWTFANHPDLSGDALRELLIAKGLPEEDAKWYGTQRAMRLAGMEPVSS